MSSADVPEPSTLSTGYSKIISRCYNLLRGALSARFSDAQCGFKAIRKDMAAQLLPMVEDAGWFFDTELLVLAERAGLRIHEVPVDWVDDPDSRVDIVATAVADLKGIARLARALGTGRLPLGRLRQQLGRQPLPAPVAGVPAGMTGQLLRFAGIGVASTVAYLLLYAVLRTAAGPQLANLLALLVTAMANTAANRRLTFGVRGTERAWRHQVQGLVIFALGLGLTSGSLAALGALIGQPPRAVELAVLIVANLAATVLRFLLLRVWVFRVGQDSQPRFQTGHSRGAGKVGNVVGTTRSPAGSTTDRRRQAAERRPVLVGSGTTTS